MFRKVVTLILGLSLMTGQTGFPGSGNPTYAADIIENTIETEAGESNAVRLTDSNRITESVPGGKLYFEPDTGKITWAEGEMEELTIPDTIGGTEVKLIGRWSLSGLKKLKKLNLPSKKNVLGEGSLAELTSIEEFVVPDSYDNIPKQCFYGCTSLKKVSLPSTITYIGEMAFYNCSALEYVDIPGNCLKIDKMAFYSCTGLKGVAFVKGSECNASAWGIFYNCKSLEKVVNIPGIRFKMFYDSGKRAEKWLSNSVSINEQKEMWRLKYGTEEEQNNKVYWIEGDELKKREDAIRDLAKEITKDCTTDREKIAKVMTWVDDKLDYERGHDNHPWAIYNGIKEMEAGKKTEQLNSCGGYSNMTQVLLQSLGIPCATFWRKNLNGEPMDHEFNAAYFEGKWRWLDTTHSDGRKEGLELGLGTPSFFYDSDHRVDYLLYRSAKGEDIYKELPLTIPVEEDTKDWANQNPSDAYTAGKAPEDPDWVHEKDPALEEEENKKIAVRKGEFPDIPVSDEGLFVFDKNTGTITGVNNTNVERINIPKTIDGVTVKAIGTGAFQNLSKLEYLTMPDTVEEIGKFAFARNYKLKRIHLSAGITELKEGILQSCSSLDSVTIPKNVRRLDKDLFSNCTSLEEALFEDYDFKIKVIETDPLGSDNYYERGIADISWHCFAGNVGRALHGLDFHETYTGTKYHRQLQALELGTDWRDNIVKIHQSQKGYREGFSPYNMDGSNSREFRLSTKAVDYEWGHFAEASRFSGYQPATWCRSFIDWDYAMAGINGYEKKEYTWADTVYAGKGGTVELEPGDMLGMGKSHWCMVGSVKELDDGTVEMWIIHGNHSDRMVMDEVRHYNKKTGIATDMEDDDYNFFRAIYKIDFSGIETQEVALDPGEGKCSLEKRVYSKGAYYGCLPDAVRDDYVFDGWYTEPDGKGLRAYPYRRLTDDIKTLYANYIYDPKAVKGVTLDKESVTVKAGDEVTLTAIVSPSDADNKDIIWRSGDFETATVENGVVKGVKPGKVTVLARTAGGPYVAYCEVKVLNESGEEEGGEEDEPEGEQDLVTYEVTGGKITFDKKSGTIVKADKTVTEADIPAEIEGVAVKAIGKEAFYKCSSLTKVLLPEGLESIGQSAFESTALHHVCIPDSVKTIEKWAFVVIDTLEYVIIGSGVESIAQWSFTSNHNLKTIYFRKDWSEIDIEDQAFGGAEKKLYDPETDPEFEVTSASQEEEKKDDPEEGKKDDPEVGKKDDPKEEEKVKPSGETGEYSFASSNDNFAAIVTEGKINKLKLDFSTVARSKISPDSLALTVIKGSKFTTVQKLQEGSIPEVSGGIKVKRNKKDGTATITCKADGSVSLTLEDNVKYTVRFTVQKPKAQKAAQKIPIESGVTVIKTVKDLFGTDINDGELTRIKGFQAEVSGNNLLVIHPEQAEKIKIQYRYLNKKYKMSIKIGG